MVDYVPSVRKPAEQQVIQGFPTQDNGMSPSRKLREKIRTTFFQKKLRKNTVGAQSIAPAQSIAHGQISDSFSQKN